MIPPFDKQVVQDGYAWWYLDAISDDGRYGLTLIAFIGSVFSPYYAWARERGRGDPLAHCAINVALYGPHGRWSMTERGRPALARDPESMQIGPSALRWDGEALVADLNEWSAPIPRRIRGRIRLHPKFVNTEAIALDPDGLHQWTPVSPAARVEVELEQPNLRWSGGGYFDHNSGTQPLERCFDTWFWCRAATQTGPVILYELQRCDGQRQALALHFDQDGKRHALNVQSATALPRTRWGVERPVRTDDGLVELRSTWEDTPFYSRSLITARLNGERVSAVHESLSLKRFSKRWVQLMLPFRMPRRGGR